MDVKRWKLVLYEWIKSTDLTDVTGSLDQVNVKEYFSKFIQRVSPDDEHDIVKFLSCNFPDFEPLMSENKQISMQDYVYLFSLLLYHACVIKEDEYFRKSCQKLEERSQLYVMKFFEFMNSEKENTVKITKDMLRRGIKETAQKILSPPPFMSLGSPIKTPTKLDRSPPLKEIGNFKLNELRHLKAQLENERYERNLLEVEVQQNHEVVENLVKKCKTLSRELQSLRNHINVEKDDENVDPNIQRVEHIKAKMEKEITARDDKICDLKTEIFELTQCKESLLEKINVIEKERKDLLSKLCDFDQTISELQAEIAIREEKIQCSEESNKELLQILSELRQKSDKDVSSDCLDFSYSTYHTGMSSTEGENLGSVIDIQLKDKEVEISTLKDMLDATNLEKEVLGKENSDLKSQISSLEHKINENEENLKVLGEKLSRKVEILKDKLKAAIAENVETQKREKDLEDKLDREKKFNDVINRNNEIFKIKLFEARDQVSNLRSTEEKLEKVTQELHQLKDQQCKEIQEVSKTYETKLEGCKEKMKSLYENAVANHADQIEKQKEAHSQEIEKHLKKIEELNSDIKRLTSNNDMQVKENKYLSDKVKFLEMTKFKSGNLDTIGISSNPFESPASEPIAEGDEQFNNEYLKEMTEEFDVDDTRTASDLQKRNSKYPPHLRDSYVMQKLDRHMNEEEMKNGGDKVPLLRSASLKMKSGTYYKRPSGIPTPSKNGRLSIGSAHQNPRDSIDHKQPKQTPSKFKQIFSKFSLNKDENNAASNDKRSSLMKLPYNK